MKWASAPPPDVLDPVEIKLGVLRCSESCLKRDNHQTVNASVVRSPVYQGAPR
jgi:hypothetical protein